MDRVIKNRKNYKIILPGIIILIIISILILRSLLHSYTPTYTLKNSELIYSFVTDKKISRTIQTIGVIEPINRITIESLENGIITDIARASGAFINSGDSILTLQNEDLNIELNILNEQIVLQKQQQEVMQNEYYYTNIEHEDSLLDTDYKLSNLKSDSEKNTLLFETGSITKEIMENSKNEYEYRISKKKLLLEKISKDRILQKSKQKMLEIELESLLKKSETIIRRMERLEIKSPFSGVLNLEEFSIGQNISKQQYLGTIDRQDNFKLVSYVDEFYIADIHIGDIAIFTLKVSNGNKYKARLDFISPVVSGSNIRLEFSILTDLQDGIRSGQSINLKILQSIPEIKNVIKPGAFFKESGGNWVYKVENGYAVKVPIEIGIKNSEYIEILSGLNIGDKVIISSYKKFKDYEKLKIEEIK